MKRQWIYYTLTLVMGGVYVAALLNTQLIIVEGSPAWSSTFNWELILAGWGSFWYVIGSLFLASLSDRFGRLRCIGITCLIITILEFMLGFHILGEFRMWHFFLLWGVSACVLAVFFTGVEGLLSDYQDHSMPLARRLGLYCIAWCIGDVIGAFATGYTKQYFGAETLYCALGFLCLASFIATLFDWRRHGDRKLGDMDIGVADIRPEAGFHAMMGRLGLFFGGFAVTALTASFPRFGRDFHLLNEGEIGNVLSMYLVGCTLTFIWFPMWKGWHYKKKLQILLQAPLFAGFVIAALTPVRAILLLRIGFLMIGVGWGTAYFFSIYYSLIVPKQHSKSGGIHEGFLGMGNLLGPFTAVAVMMMVKRTDLMPPHEVGISALLLASAITIISFICQGLFIMLYKQKQSGDKKGIIH